MSAGLSTPRSTVIFNGIGIRVTEVADDILLRASDVGRAVRVRDIRRECKGSRIARHCRMIQIKVGFGFCRVAYLTAEGAAAMADLSRSPKIAAAFREWVKGDFIADSPSIPQIAAVTLPAVKFEGNVIRLAQAGSEMLLHAEDCGRCVGLLVTPHTCAELLSEHTREIPGPYAAPHLYLTAAGAAELSKLSKDYDLPKAFRAWLKSEFPKTTERDEFDTTEPTVEERKAMISAVLTPTSTNPTEMQPQ